MEVGRKEKRPQRGQAKGIKVKSKTRVEGSKLSAPMNFRKSPRIAPPPKMKAHLNRLFYSCAPPLFARVRSSLPLSPCETRRGKSFIPPTARRCETETPTFARAGEDNWIPTKLGTVVSRLSQVFGNGILAWSLSLPFLTRLPSCHMNCYNPTLNYENSSSIFYSFFP